MNEASVNNYLNSTGGVRCSFTDIPCPNVAGSAVTDTTGADTFWRYVEVMAQQGITTGCTRVPDKFCPNDPVTRGEAAAFIIRAKMENVFPSVLFRGTGDDKFNQFVPITPFFSDVPPTDPNFLFIQKMRELRITNGTGDTTFSPNNPITRKELVQFLVRAFFL